MVGRLDAPSHHPRSAKRTALIGGLSAVLANGMDGMRCSQSTSRGNTATSIKSRRWLWQAERPGLGRNLPQRGTVGFRLAKPPSTILLRHQT